MRRASSALALFALAALACSGKESGLSIPAGPFSVSVSSDARTISLTKGTEVFLRFPADAFELGVVGALDDNQSYDPFWLEAKDHPLYVPPPPDLRFLDPIMAHVTKTGSELSIEETYSSHLSATVSIRVATSTDTSARFVVEVVPHGSVPIAYVRLRPRASADEAFYGLGEWPDDVDHRGKLRPMQIEADGSTESGYNEAHIPVPLLIGTRGWGLFVESRRYGLFDVARKAADLVEITYGTAADSASGLTFHLFGAAHPLDVTKLYYDASGTPALPAPWAYGPWIWRNHTDQARFQADVLRIRALDLPTSGVWIDDPYQRAVSTFDFDPALFPDPGHAISLAKELGFHVGAWTAPYIDKSAGTLAEDAQAKGYFPPKPGILLNHWSPPIDFTNPTAFAFWQTQIEKLTALGIDGFKLDYGEDVVAGIGGGRTPWGFADGSDERTAAYGYTLLYHRAYRERLPAEGTFLLCRAARWGDQVRGAIIWPGDLDSTLSKRGESFVPRGESQTVHGTGGLPTSLVMGLSLGPSGFPFYASDTGGYRHAPADKETYVRWFEQTALSSAMQTGDSSSQTPWEFSADNGRDATTLDLYRTFARLHLRLFPYVWSYASRLAQDGRAIMRPEGLAHPELGVHPNDVYLLGDDLLVAPVVEAGVTMRSIVFPAGRWIDWWDGSVHMGTEDVAAPLEKLPLYLRAGAVVPMLRPNIATLSEVSTSTLAIESYASAPGRLWLRFAPGDGSLSFTVFDGSKIELSRRALDFTPGTVFDGGAMVEMFAAGALPNAVILDGDRLSSPQPPAALEGMERGWAYASDAGGTVYVLLPPGAHHVEVP